MMTVVLLFSAPTSEIIWKRRSSGAAGFSAICKAAADNFEKLQFGFSLDDPRALFPDRLGLHLHHLLHRFRQLDILHFKAFNLEAPSLGRSSDRLLEQAVDFVPLLKHFVEIVLADDIAQARPGASW